MRRKNILVAMGNTGKSLVGDYQAVISMIGNNKSTIEILETMRAIRKSVRSVEIINTICTWMHNDVAL